MDQQSWPFGSVAVLDEDAFNGEHQAQVSWMQSEYKFEPQGTQTNLRVVKLASL